MTPAALLFRLESLGIHVRRVGDDQLGLSPASGVPAELIPEIQQRKPELLRMLADDLDETDRSVLRWLDVTNDPSQSWRYERTPRPKGY